MASPQRNTKDPKKLISRDKEDIEYVQRTLEKLLCPDEEAETGMLRSRISEQSSLIGVLKRRTDETLLRCQSLQKINAELEDLVADGRRQLAAEKQKSATLENRFAVLASNHHDMINFKDEYKRQNAQLKMDNEKLRAENQTLFSKDLRDKDALVGELTREIEQLADTRKNMEHEHRGQIAEWQVKLKEQMTLRLGQEASLRHDLCDVQKQLKDAVEMCTGLKAQLQEAGEDCSLQQSSMKDSIAGLTREKDTFLTLSMARGKVIQEKQEEIHQLETKCKEEGKARVAAEERFQQEAAAVNADVKVRRLQSALHDSVKTCKKLQQDFEAYKEHSANLLTQEKELNTKLRHMFG